MTTSVSADIERPTFGRRDPDARGYFGDYGGRFVPETLVAPIEELTAGYLAARADAAFQDELARLLAHYVGRPTPLYETSRLLEGSHSIAGSQDPSRRTTAAAGVRIFLKREDLTHTGAHKINNALGQALLAKRMGKRASSPKPAPASTAWPRRPRARCSASSASSTWAPKTCDARRSTSCACSCSGATVTGVDAGSRTLKDAINEAMRDWVANVTDTYYLLGSALGPHPYPLMVREFQSVIGREARRQILEQAGRLPDVVVACVGGGSNAIGIFDGFIEDPDVRLIGVEAGGETHRAGTPRRPFCRRQHRRAAGHAHLRPAGRGRQHRADALDLGRARLRRGRA